MNIWALIAIMEEKNISTYNLSKLSKMDSSNLNRIINKKVKNPKIDTLSSMKFILILYLFACS